ncbi:C4-dicarboxylate transporter DcuC [Consotaella salsifontis]|uniref:C4-dicarboxylate transporter, DcuC family n=1 Tax=Consotaella salsifontis TaxID=1365950 RepID=A0A1T4S7B3_9HYPH|nr:C4-dicarboxylate transporter DcuC [Consotaella salsifontis]SKA24210.1 C4-dicarboxylate transporter, DcuC family [Consotaella salsifontis]
MLGFLVGFAVTIAVAWLIIRNYQPHTVLIVAGLLLLGLTLVISPETSILFGKSDSTGLAFFDIFNYASENLSVRTAGLGMIIMAAGGFSKYMDKIGATDAMVDIAIRPLKLLNAPYVVLALGYGVGQVLNIFIPSAAGLAMLLLATFFPTLVRLGVSRAAAAAMIGTTAMLDLGPASGNVNLAAKTAGLDVSVYFVQYQLPVSIAVILVVMVLTYVSGRYFDGRRGHVVEAEALHAGADENDGGSRAPTYYALLPMVPLTLILVFSKLLVSSIKLDVVTAMLIGVLLAFVFELIRHRNGQKVFKGFMAFFDGMGHMFGRIVSLIICAEVFASGLKTIGMVGFLIDTAQNAGLGVTAMTLVMCLIVIVVTVIVGSGNAAFFSFGHLAPNVAAGFGAAPVSMLLPMQLTAGLARSMSPVAGVIIAVSDAGECTPFEIVRRTVLPVMGGIVTVLLFAVFA